MSGEYEALKHSAEVLAVAIAAGRRNGLIYVQDCSWAECGMVVVA